MGVDLFRYAQRERDHRKAHEKENDRDHGYQSDHGLLGVAIQRRQRVHELRVAYERGPLYSVVGAGFGRTSVGGAHLNGGPLRLGVASDKH